MTFSLPVLDLKAAFGDRLRENESLSRYTSARVGGPADVLLEAHTTDELAEMAFFLWQKGLPFIVLGGGSNILVSDAGVTSEHFRQNRAARDGQDCVRVRLFHGLYRL